MTVLTRNKRGKGEWVEDRERGARQMDKHTDRHTVRQKESQSYMQCIERRDEGF